jgi:hypothetical protein
MAHFIKFIKILSRIIWWGLYNIISDENIKKIVKKERDYMLALQGYDRELSCIIQF